MTIFETVENGDLNTLKRLINNHPEDDVIDYINSQNPITGISLLHIAAKNGFLDICEYLQQNGALIDITDLKGKTPLHYAAKGSHENVCRFLIENKAFIDAKDVFNFFTYRISLLYFNYVLFYIRSFLIEFYFKF